MVNIVCFKHRPCEFLNNVILFVCYSCRGQDAYAVRTVLFLYFAELSGNKRERFVPGSFPEAAVFLYKRIRKALGGVDKIISESSLYAETTEIWRNVIDSG